MRRWQIAEPEALTRRLGDGVAFGLLVGAAAGAVTAVADFGAQWLWLDDWRDRGMLLARLGGMQAPAGALAGALVGAVAVAVRDARRRALALALCAAPPLIWIAVQLFGGGQASQVPFRTAWQTLAAVVLVAGAATTFYAASRLVTIAWHERPRAPRIAAAFALAGLLLDKVDQHVLPNLYLYLHAALGVSSWIAYACALTALAPLVRLRMRALGAGATLAAVLLGAGATWTLHTLDANQNVRVAMHGPRASHSASLMRLVGPLAVDPHEAARQATRASRPLVRRRLAPGEGPVLENAHILLVTIDALRPDHLGAYGYTRPTSPEMDRHAAQSVLFEHVYTPAPHSSYALSSLHASEYLHQTLELGRPAPSQTLATTLADAGYHTAAFYTSGIFHTADAGLEQYEKSAFGFTLYDRTYRPAGATTDRVLEEVDRTVARGEPNGLFWVHYFDVHEPYAPTTFGTSDLDRYDGEILAVDAAFGQLVREMRARLSRDLIVIVTADHGEEFREHGGVYHGSSLYEEQVRIPLWIDVPGIAPRRVAGPIELVDVVPTLLGLVGVSVPPTMRGDDLRPLLVGEEAHAALAFSAVIHKKMVVRWPYKLVADLRFGLFELYDLERDPRERTNLADAEAALRSELTGEVYAWVDALADTRSGPDDSVLAALERGRLSDRRATVPLARLVADESAERSQRVEAAHLLARLADPNATSGLLSALASKDAWVSGEAAIALGRMFDPRARDRLRALVDSEDPELRSRAAVSLGRLRDPAAVPGLIDALWVAPELYEREEAVRWLGRLQDSRAIEPLISLLPELRTRALAVVAMGHIGDARAYEPLVDVLRWDHHPNVRDNVVRGLGLLGDPRAIEVVLPIVTDEPTLEHPAETLVRLGAVEAGAIGGTDFGRIGRGVRGLARCSVGPLLHDWDYLHRTYCETRRQQASFVLEIPPAVERAAGPVIALLAARRLDGHEPIPVRVAIGERALDTIDVDDSWAQHRWEIPPGVLTGKQIQASFEGATPGARFALDHFLLVPKVEALARGRD